MASDTATRCSTRGGTLAERHASRQEESAQGYAISQTIAMLQQHGRVSYRALKRQFALDDAFLEDLTYELITVQQRAIGQDGTVLVWTGDTGAAAAPLPAPATPAAVLPPVSSPTQEPLAYTPAYLDDKILRSRSALEGERKQVTVLFADLKGSMELLADRDPEEARQLLAPVLERMMAAVHRYEGTVNQVMGDGIMALFGAPIAHEDHAVRACYAALAMHAAMRAYAEDVRRTQGLTVQMRVGLNSGEVVVRTIGNDLHTSAPTYRFPCSRPLPSCPRPRCTAVWPTYRPQNFSTRRVSSRSRCIPSSMP